MAPSSSLSTQPRACTPLPHRIEYDECEALPPPEHPTPDPRSAHPTTKPKTKPTSEQTRQQRTVRAARIGKERPHAG